MSASQPLATAPAGTQTERAMVLMIIAMLILPGIDAIAKWLSPTIAAGQIAWSRFFFQTLLMLPLFLRVPGRVLGPDLWLHAARGALIALATLLFFAALKFLPVADAIAIFFVEPLFLTLLAALFLGETLGWRRLSAVGVGLAGALLVIRPNFHAFGWAAALPLGTAGCFAVYLIITRQLAQREDPVRMQFYAGVFGALVMSAALGFGALADAPVLIAVWPSVTEWALLAGLGLIATTGHLLVVHAFKRAPAGILAPFQYVEIIGATVLGLVIFGDFPDLLTWCGVAVIVASGIYVFHRERTLAR